MSFALIPFSSEMLENHAAHALLECNQDTQRFGLSLTQAQAVALVKTRDDALRASGRIEFGGGIIEKMLQEFCDSPHLHPHDFAETLQTLVELFYEYKNETMDLLSDDALIAFMKTSFDGVCQGSLELLAERELYQLAKRLRLGYTEEDEDA